MNETVREMNESYPRRRIRTRGQTVNTRPPGGTLALTIVVGTFTKVAARERIQLAVEARGTFLCIYSTFSDSFVFLI